MSGGFLSSGEKRTPEQIAQIEAANRMEPIEFTTPSGSQGVTNENYAKYTDSYPDLLSNYNSNWRDKGVSKSEFGAMHWMQSGKGEGRSMPGISSPSAPAESFGGASVATPTASPSPVASNPYYPQLVQEYEAPGLVDYSSYMPADSIFGYEQYQPYTNPNNIPDGIFNYQPPTIYATDPRISLGDLARTSGVGGRIMPTRPMGGGGFEGGSGGGFEGGSSESSSAETSDGRAGTALGDATDYIVPGTNTSIQSLLDYQAGPTESLIYDEDGNIERKYYVNPSFLRPELVAADINRAKEQAYIEAAKKDVPIVQQNLPSFRGRKEPITMPQLVAMESSANNYIQDQIRAEQARMAREIQNRNPNTVFGPPPKTEADFANDSRGLMAFREAEAKGR
tara:strand:- start:202 stop:1386 length:1185 start_codon:yes stop_codon:yes gene_type:complete